MSANDGHVPGRGGVHLRQGGQQVVPAPASGRGAGRRSTGRGPGSRPWAAHHARVSRALEHQEGADQVAAARRHPQRAGAAGAPGHAEQDGLGLVGCGVAGRDPGVALPGGHPRAAASRASRALACTPGPAGSPSEATCAVSPSPRAAPATPSASPADPGRRPWSTDRTPTGPSCSRASRCIRQRESAPPETIASTGAPAGSSAWRRQWAATRASMDAGSQPPSCFANDSSCASESSPM